MRYKPFGKTGMDISGVAIGTWGLGGGAWGDVDKNGAIKAIHTMLDLGVNLIDTAPAYGKGISEEIVGEAIVGRRDKVFISTKCGIPITEDRTRNRDGSRAQVIAGCEDSLRRLNIDYIDVLFQHWPDTDTPIQETMEAMNDLKKQGKIRHIGVSNYSPEQMEECLKYVDLEVLQPPFSMVDQSAREIMQWANNHNIANMTYGSMGAGILSGKIRELIDYGEGNVRGRFYSYFNEPGFSQVMELLKVMDVIADAHGVPVSHVAIAWTFQKEYVHTALIGVRTEEHAKENCAAMDFVLSDEEMAILDKEVDARFFTK